MLSKYGHWIKVMALLSTIMFVSCSNGTPEIISSSIVSEAIEAVPPNSSQNQSEMSNQSSLSNSILWDAWPSREVSCQRIDLGEIFLIIKILVYDQKAFLLHCDKQDSFCLGVINLQPGGEMQSIALETTLDIAISDGKIVALHNNGVSYYDVQLNLLQTESIDYLGEKASTQPRLSEDGKNILYIGLDKTPIVYNIESKQITDIGTLELPSGETASDFSFIAQNNEKAPLMLIAHFASSKMTDEGYFYFYYHYIDRAVAALSVTNDNDLQKILIDVENEALWSSTMNDHVMRSELKDGLAIKNNGGEHFEIVDLSKCMTYSLFNIGGMLHSAARDGEFVVGLMSQPNSCFSLAYFQV